MRKRVGSRPHQSGTREIKSRDLCVVWSVSMRGAAIREWIKNPRKGGSQSKKECKQSCS